MEKLLIKPEPKKEKLQFLNSLYYKPFYHPSFKKTYGDDMNDFLAIVYRNEETNEKKLKVMANPSIQFFVANDDVEINQAHLNQIELEKVHIEKVKYKHLLRYICQLKDEYEGTETNFVENYYRDGNIRKGLTYEANKFHLYNRVFASDIHIEDYWKGRFIDTYKDASSSKLTKAYTDIEVDSIDISGFPDQTEALCPINAITVFFEENMTFFTLVLRNSSNPQIEELEKEKEYKKFIKELKETFGKEFKFKIVFFDDELDMIQYYFDLNNKLKPDYNLIWNMDFDMNYILNRIGYLCGFSTEDRLYNKKYEFLRECGEVCSHPDFPDFLKVAQFIKDTRNQKAAERIDVFRCASYTYWIDQLCLYASIRKGMGELESLALSYVAQKEVNDDKLNYMEDGSNIKTLPYDDFKKFLMYNIKDVLLLYKIEKKNDDIGLLYSIAEITKTRIDKAMRKTVSLKNMAHHFYIDQGYALGNNFNMNFDGGGNEDTTKFEGMMIQSALAKFF